jgi:hypothetical protein
LSSVRHLAIVHVTGLWQPIDLTQVKSPHKILQRERPGDGCCPDGSTMVVGPDVRTNGPVQPPAVAKHS